MAAPPPSAARALFPFSSRTVTFPRWAFGFLREEDAFAVADCSSYRLVDRIMAATVIADLPIL